MVNGVCVDAAPTLAKEGIDPLVLEAKEGLALVNGTDGMLGMLALGVSRRGSPRHDRRHHRGDERRSAARHRRCVRRRTSSVCARTPGQARSAANLRRAARRLADRGVTPCRRLAGAGRLLAALRPAGARRGPGRAGARGSGVRGGARCRDRQPGRARRTGGSARTATFTARRSAYGARLPGDRAGRSVVDGRATRRPDARSGTLPRPAALPRRHAGGGLGTDDRPVHRSGVGGREPPARRRRPASTSIPTSAMQEDHVSMGWAAARKLRTVIENLGRVLAIEFVAAARAIELRSPLSPGAGTAAAVARAPRRRRWSRARPVGHARPRRGLRCSSATTRCAARSKPSTGALE